MSSFWLPGFIFFYIILSKIKPKWALMLLLSFLPAYQVRFNVAGIPTTLLEVMILVLFAVWVIFSTRFLDIFRGKYRWADFKKSYRRRLPYPFRLEIMLWLLISYGAMAATMFSNSAMGIWKAYFWEPVIIYLLILNIFVDRDKKRFEFEKVIYPLAASMLIASVIALWQRLTGDLAVPAFAPRATGVFTYPNALGLYLGPLVLLVFGYLANQFRSIGDTGCLSRHPVPRVLGVVAILSVLAILAAESEGALAGVLAGLAFFFFFYSKKTRWVTLLILIIISAGVMAIPKTRDFAVKKITLRDLSGEIRKQQWRETREMLNEGRIISGAGLDNYQASVKPFHQEGIFFNHDDNERFRLDIVFGGPEKQAKYWQPVEIYMYPHNILLNFWTELGLAGMILFLLIVAKFFIIGFKVKGQMSKVKGLALGLMSAMVVILVHGIVDVPYFKNDLAVMFWVLLALMGVLRLNYFNEKDTAKIHS